MLRPKPAALVTSLFAVTVGAEDLALGDFFFKSFNRYPIHDETGNGVILVA